VRFIDNFSTGSRGAASAEEFLRGSGASVTYAVIFLHRRGAPLPYLRKLDLFRSASGAQFVSVDDAGFLSSKAGHLMHWGERSRVATSDLRHCSVRVQSGMRLDPSPMQCVDAKR